MVKKYFYLINYIIDISLFGYKGQVFCMEPKGCKLVLHVDIPKKDNPLQKRRDVSVRGYIVLPPFLTLILIQQLTQSSSLITKCRALFFSLIDNTSSVHQRWSS